MSKTTINILRKNRKVKKVKVKASTGLLEFENGCYIITANGINRISKNEKMAKGSEMFFFEGNPSPIPIKKPDKDDVADPSAKYLDDMIYVNFLEQTGAPKPEQFRNAMKLIRPLTNPASMFKILLAVLILGTLARSWLTQFV